MGTSLLTSHLDEVQVEVSKVYETVDSFRKSSNRDESYNNSFNSKSFDGTPSKIKLNRQSNFENTAVQSKIVNLENESEKWKQRCEKLEKEITMHEGEEKISKDESSREKLTNTNKEVNDLNKSIKSQLKDSQKALDKLQDELKKANLELNKKEQLIKKFENRQTDFENRNFEQNIASQSISAIERIRQGSGSEIISMGQPSLLSSVQLDDCDVNELPISPSKCFPNSVSSYKSNTSLLTTGKNNNITNLRNNYSNHNKYDDNNSDNRYEID